MSTLNDSPTDGEKSLKLRPSDKYVIFLSIAAAIMTVLILLFGDQLKWLPYVQLLIVLMTMYGIYHFRGPRTEENENSSMFGVGLLPLMLVVISFSLPHNHYHAVDDHTLWKTVWTVFWVLLLLYLVCSAFSRLTIILRILSIVSYGFLLLATSQSIVTYTNMAMDNSHSERYRSTILKKQISKGKYTNYYVTLSSWDVSMAPKKTQVSLSYYEKVEVGQEVEIDVYPGRLDIPWYELVTK